MDQHKQAEWFYVGTYGQLGPLTLDQIQELVRDRVVEPETYVWKSTFSTWVMARNAPELAPSFSGLSQDLLPPPLPGQSPPPMVSPPTPSPMMPAPHLNRPLMANPQMYALQYLPRSDRSRIAGGILQLLVPGIGRIYLGYYGIGFLQLVLVLMCGIGYIWSLIDGIAILCGTTRIDGFGRALPD
ncbi:MAG: DUF4339 domain-containing protein [Armatimonadetes bacterium]|nr:DUF4339 domain-containing protein [Armatimonadota bacterium]